MTVEELISPQIKAFVFRESCDPPHSTHTWRIAAWSVQALLGSATVTPFLMHCSAMQTANPPEAYQSVHCN